MTRIFTFSVCGLLCLACGAGQKPTPRVKAVTESAVALWVTSGEEDLPIFFHEGNYLLLGRENAPYRIWIKNRTDTRIEAVVSVDGTDVISGRPADYRQHRGYVLEPDEAISIDGFRTSLDSEAQFYFSTPEESYASRMGEGRNTGVIGVAVFAEAPHTKDIARPDEFAGPQPSSSARAESELGTGYGEEVSSPASVVPFVRLRPDTPDEIAVLYYDSEEGLKERGVVIGDEPAPRDANPNPFPGTAGPFAPPPPPQTAPEGHLSKSR